MPRRVMVDIDPITEEPLDEPQPYYVARFGNANKVYLYLIPEGENGVPTMEEVKKTINRYARHPSELGSRDISYYLADEPEGLTGL